MGSVDRPTLDDLAAAARSPEAWQQAVDRFGIDALTNPDPQHGVGLGDVVAAATSALGIRPCEPCKQRQQKLNRIRFGR